MQSCRLVSIELQRCKFPTRWSSRSNVIKVFAYRSKIFASVLVSGPVYPDVPSRDPNPRPKSWFSAFFRSSPVSFTHGFSRGPQNRHSVAAIHSVRYILSVITVLILLSGKVCDHEGPCHEPTRGKCDCYTRKVHCSRNCLCAQSCESDFHLLYGPPLRVIVQVSFDGMPVCVEQPCADCAQERLYVRLETNWEQKNSLP